MSIKMCPVLSCMSLAAEQKAFPCMVKQCAWYDLNKKTCCVQGENKLIEVIN